MKGKEQHLQLTYSLTSTYCCCNSRSTSHWPALCSHMHTAPKETMARAFVAGLHRVTLQ